MSRKPDNMKMSGKPDNMKMSRKPDNMKMSGKPDNMKIIFADFNIFSNYRREENIDFAIIGKFKIHF